MSLRHEICFVMQYLTGTELCPFSINYVLPFIYYFTWTELRPFAMKCFVILHLAGTELIIMSLCHEIGFIMYCLKTHGLHCNRTKCPITN